MTHFEAVFEAVKKDHLPRHQFWVYVAVVSFWNHETGRCDPSVSTIAKRAKVSKSAAKTALRDLEELGLVLPQQRRSGTTNLSNSYRLPGLHDAPVGHTTPHLGHTVTEGEAHGDRGVGHTVTPNKEPQQRREQKTSSRSREKRTDPRFQEFVAELADYWKAMNPGIPFDLTGKDGSQLKGLLKDRAGLTRTLFRTCLINRSKSDDVNHAKAPCFWLSKVTDYATEPLNKYGQPKGPTDAKAGKHQPAPNRAKQNRDFTNQGIAESFTELFGSGVSGSDGADDGVFPSPAGDQGHDEGMGCAVGGTDGDLWPGGFHGRTIASRA